MVNLPKLVLHLFSNDLEDLVHRAPSTELLNGIQDR